MAEITSNFELMIFFFYREKKRRETNVKDILQPDRFDYITPKIKLYSLRASLFATRKYKLLQGSRLTNS